MYLFIYDNLPNIILNLTATGCSLNIFKSPFKERLKAYANRLQWADGSSSDLIAYLNLYKVIIFTNYLITLKCNGFYLGMAKTKTHTKRCGCRIRLVQEKFCKSKNT